MPLGNDFFGTKKDKTETKEYCKFCYLDGEFTNPNLTQVQMINMSVENMVTEVGFSKQKAQKLANEYIPNLKRWKSAK